MSIAANNMYMSASGNYIHISVSVDFAYIQRQFFSCTGQQPLITLRVLASLNLSYLSMLVELIHMSAPAYFVYISASTINVGTRWRSLLRHSATSWKVAGSNLWDFFVDLNPFRRSIALGSTQPLTEISTKSISGRGGWGMASTLG